VRVDAEVVLRLEGGSIATVAIRDHRPRHLLAGLVGRPAEALPPLLERLFPVCGKAHRIAAARAIEAAGPDRAGGDEAERAIVLEAEIALAHAFRACVDWPALVGWPGDQAGLRAVALAARSGGDRAGLGRCLARAVFAGTPPRRLTPQGILAWAAAAPGATAAFVRAVQALDDPMLTHRLLVRLASIRHVVDGLAAPAPRSPAPKTPPVAAPAVAGHGRGTALTSRGPLTYAVELAAGLVVGLANSAPTDRLLAPDGPLPARLVGWPASGAERRAALTLAVLDPCAVVGVQVREPAHA